jgi:threonine/homoserine/homoserine lactone efflux protein
MKSNLVAAFATIDLLLVLTPGPDWAYVVAVGLRDQMVLPAVAGLVAGYAALTVLVAAGLAVLITTSPAALTAVTLLGGAYLIWLGASVLSRPPAAKDTAFTRPPGAASSVHVAARGAATSGLNPKGLLLFVAVLPQFVDRHGTVPIAAQIGVLGAIHMGNCGVAYLGVGTLARNLLIKRPAAAYTVTRAAGVAMVVLGMLLVLERALS